MPRDARCHETSPLQIGGVAVVALGLAAALLVVPGRADDAPRHSAAAGEVVAIDMASGWLRRDWQRCTDRTRITFAEGAIAFESHSSAALVWQVPTPAGPLEVDPTLDWVRACDRPPLSFFRSLAARRGTAMLADVSEFPRLVWRWRVEGTIDDSAIARPDGRIRRERDDFAAKLGVLVQAQGGDDAHEIAYVWARSLPLGTVLYQETTVIPIIMKARCARVVVETGEGRGTWVEESRDVRADFARIVPGKQAGRVLRIHLMTDSDDTGGGVAAAYADIRFVGPLRSRPSLADAGGLRPFPAGREKRSRNRRRQRRLGEPCTRAGGAFFETVRQAQGLPAARGRRARHVVRRGGDAGDRLSPAAPAHGPAHRDARRRADPAGPGSPSRRSSRVTTSRAWVTPASTRWRSS